MPEAILVLLRHPEEAGLLLDAAANLAESMGFARINALAVRETIEIAPTGSATLAGRSEAILVAREEERQRVLTLGGLFTDWVVSPARHGKDPIGSRRKGARATLSQSGIGGRMLSLRHDRSLKIGLIAKRSGWHSSARTGRFLWCRRGKR